MQSPNKVARVLLAFVIGSTIFADYWEYSKAYHGNPDWYLDVLRGTASAPQQYRIGVARLAGLLVRFGHLGMRHALALIDLAGAVVAVYLLYSLFERSAAYRAAGVAARWFGAASFVLLVQYYFFWLTWYQKPETLASAATLAATLWLLRVRLPLPRGRGDRDGLGGDAGAGRNAGFHSRRCWGGHAPGGGWSLLDARGQLIFTSTRSASDNEPVGRPDRRRDPIFFDARRISTRQLWEHPGV